MTDLCVDLGYNSLNHIGEELCGDHIEIVEQGDQSKIIVLADGLGSGVKASILSTLTSKIIATMLNAGMSLEDCVQTIADTLPVCSVRNVAYSTFTIIHVLNKKEADIFQYDNPHVILLRNGVHVDYPMTELNIGGKKIYRSHVRLEEGDIFVAMSDGCIHAGVGLSLNFGWQRDNIIQYLETFSQVGFTAKTLATMLLDECNRLYDGVPGDDTTVFVLRVRRREPMNLMFGPPSNRNDCDRMMSLFFAKEGKHVICGGTTSSIAAKHLNKPIVPVLEYPDPDIPPIAQIDGVDLVTEGIITMNRVLEYAKDYLGDNKKYEKWSFMHDGASLLSRLLFEEATDINFFVGRAVNPAHQNPELPINFHIKMNLVTELADCLRNMGKRVKINYF
ncbi:MAG: serine/threonine-protein phosphatase [Ruminococcaceae bacterium]|nr:serine/threonine-protein phosphatase [Oscillospiraceae bacterium]